VKEGTITFSFLHTVTHPCKTQTFQKKSHVPVKPKFLLCQGSQFHSSQLKLQREENILTEEKALHSVFLPIMRAIVYFMHYSLITTKYCKYMNSVLFILNFKLPVPDDLKKR